MKKEDRVAGGSAIFPEGEDAPCGQCQGLKHPEFNRQTLKKATALPVPACLHQSPICSWPGLLPEWRFQKRGLFIINPVPAPPVSAAAPSL
jgi:hypothetical protein